MVPLMRVECYWDLKQISFNVGALLTEIILTDFPSQCDGHSEIESSVFLFAADNNLLFHLYDDRGLDLVAQDKTTLYNFYEKYNEWILPHDRKRMESIFASLEKQKERQL